MQHHPDPERTEWLKRVETALKGAAFDADAVLQGRLSGPRAIKPAHAPWRIFTRVDSKSAAAAAAQAKDDLAHGANGLVLASADLAPALDGLPIHSFALRNESGDMGAEAIRLLVARQPLDPARLAIDFAVSDVALAKVLVSAGFSSPLMKGDGRMFHAAGASDAEELGAALADAVGKLRKLEFLDDAALASSVSLTLAATQDMFTTMAKFRAARILWARILAAAKLPAAPLALHGETSMLMMAATDAHTNILRSVAAAFGAGLGGADSLCVLPFSQAQGVPNGFARRVARNLQYMLLHESDLWRVDDAAAGAGFVERQTYEIAEKAWQAFQAAEKGHWPSGNPELSPVKPAIGVSAYKPPKDFPPEIEA